MLLERAFVVGAAFLLDLALGDPHWLWHPVRGMGCLTAWGERAVRRLFGVPVLRPSGEEGGACPEEESARDASGRRAEASRPARERAAGAALALWVLFVSVAVPIVLLCAAEQIGHGLRVGLEIWMSYRMLAMKSLRTESGRVYRELAAGNVEGARRAVSMIVGRDTERLSADGIVRAAVETVAENTSDGVAAPLLYLFLFGAPGGFGYKAVNTMDSMIGYRNERYRYLGTAAARLDDAVNFLPARLSAAAMILAAFLLRMDGKGALRIYRRDRRKHKSPNSAQTEAVCAGALGIRLAGDAWYFGERCEKPTIGDDLRRVEPRDILRAHRLLYGTGWIVLAAGEILCGAVWLAGRWFPG